MAEALGLASGVIAVVDMATKVGVASIKLKRLWDEVKDAPYMLLQKAAQVQDFEEFLIDTECQVATNPLPATAWNSDLLQKYIAKARTVLSELQEIIDDLLNEATAGRAYKRKIGSTRAVIRKADMKTLDVKIDQALNLFKMAQGQYIIALLTSTHVISVEGPSERCQDPERDTLEPVTPMPLANSFGKPMENRSADSISRDLLDVFHERTTLGKLRFVFGSGTGFQFILRTPDWFSTSVYSVLGTRSTLGWQVSLRAYEVVDNFDELEPYIELDDTVGVFRFLAERKMSPFVRDRFGHNLLRWASYYTSSRLVNSLFDTGLGYSALEPINDRYSDPWLYEELSNSIINLERDSEHEHQQAARAIIELFARHGFDEELMLSSQTFARMGPGRIELFRSLSGSRYYTYPVKERLALLRFSQPCHVSDLFNMLPEAKSNPSDLLRKSRSPGTCSLIHSIASGLALQLCTQASDQLTSVTQHSWYEFACGHIALDTDGIRHLESPRGMYPILRPRQTPFATLLNSILSQYHFGFRSRKPKFPAKVLSQAVALWIEAVFSCNINLLDYGRNEMQLCQQGAQNIRQRHLYDYACSCCAPSCSQKSLATRRRDCNNSRQSRMRFSFIGITFGPRPEHWKMWWALDHEDYAGEFWHMVEQPRLVIPGAWVDDTDFLPNCKCKDAVDWVREETPLVWSEYRKIGPPA